MSSEALAGIIGFVVLGIITILARLFWTGFQTTIVEAVLNSILNKLLADMKQRLELLQQDAGFIKTAQAEIQRGLGAYGTELNALRTRFDQHQVDSGAVTTEFYDFRRAVTAFITGVETFMRDHQHGTAASMSGLPVPPVVPEFQPPAPPEP